MPNWQSVDEAYAGLMAVQKTFEECLDIVIRHRNGGALPALEILAAEVDKLTRLLLAALGAQAAANAT